MSKQKCTASCLSIKQYFCCRPKQKVTAVNPPKSANICSGSSKKSFNFVVQYEQHSTIANVSSVSASHQSIASYNNTFQSWIKLKGFDESLQINVFTLHVNGGIICLLCS